MKSFGGLDRGAYTGPTVTVDVVSIRLLPDGHIGVAQYLRAREPERGRVALPGAYVYKGDKLLEVAKVALEQRCGVTPENLKLVHVADDHQRDIRGDSVSFVFLETGRTQVEKYALAQLNAFDHNLIFEEVMSIVAEDLALKTTLHLLPEVFTLRQAFDLFTMLSRTNVDRSHFIKSHVHLWVGTGVKEKDPRGRPAELFKLA